MTQNEILLEIRRLSPIEQLTLAETVLHWARENLQAPLSSVEDEQAMAVAAQALREDYLNDKELTAFTVLDGEDFYEPG